MVGRSSTGDAKRHRREDDNKNKGKGKQPRRGQQNFSQVKSGRGGYVLS